MISIITKTTVMFLLILFSVRIMGKKNLGEFQPGDLVSTIIISNLTSIMIEEPDLPIINSIFPILLIMSFEVFLSIVVKKSVKLSDIIQGKSMILVENGVINQKTMKNLRLSVDDLLEAMRAKEIFYLEDVALAIVETTGAVNFCKRNDSFDKEKTAIPALPVISDGVVLNENLNILGVNMSSIDKPLKKAKLNIEDVFLMTLDSNGKHNITVKERF